MRTLWEQYVFRRGSDANELWERLFESRPIRLLYIAGSGFDVRAQSVMREFINSLRSSGGSVEEAKLLRSRHSGTVLAAGLLIAGFLAVPIVNLLTPLFAAGLMVHLHKALTARDRAVAR